MQDKSFEANLVDLEEIVKELENGNVELEAAIEKYSRAMQIAKICNDKLTAATDKVNKILVENGNLEDFDIEEE